MKNQHFCSGSHVKSRNYSFLGYLGILLFRTLNESKYFTKYSVTLSKFFFKKIACMLFSVSLCGRKKEIHITTQVLYAFSLISGERSAF